MRLAVPFALVAVAMPALADVVVLANGDRLTGKVDAVTSGAVLLQTEYAGLISIDQAAVASIETDAPLTVQVGDERLEGRFVAGDVQRLIGDRGAREVAVGQIGRAAVDNTAFDATTSAWESRADVTTSITSGNSDTAAYNLRAETKRKFESSRHRIAAALDRSEDDGDVIKDEYDIDYEYNRFFSEKWFFSANSEYFQDQLKDVDYRITLGAGLGRQFWDNSLGALQAELGISAVIEELDADSEVNPALRWALRYNRFLVEKRLELVHNHEILALADSDRGQILDSSTGLRLQVSDSIDATMTLDWRYETEPADGRKESDFTYTLGLGYRF